MTRCKIAFFISTFLVVTFCFCFSVNATEAGVTKYEYYDVEQNDEYIQDICDMYQLDSNLIKSMIYVESSCRTNVISDAGCVGLMQISPRWHEDRCARLGLTTADLSDGNANILVGCDYVSELINTYGDIAFALMVYNQGYTSAKETYNTSGISNYAKKIINNVNKEKSQQN